MKQAGWLQGNRRKPSSWLRLITGCWGIICHIFCRCRHEPTSSAHSPAGGLVGGAAGTGGASGGFSKSGGASAGGPSAAPMSAAADSDSTAPSPDGAVTVVVSPTPGSKTGKPWLAHICMHICPALAHSQAHAGSSDRAVIAGISHLEQKALAQSFCAEATSYWQLKSQLCYWSGHGTLLSSEDI